MPELSPTLQLEISRIIAAEKARQSDIARAWRYYDGDAPQPLVVIPVLGKPGIDDNVRVNFSRLLVDTGVHYLFGQPLGINFDEGKEGEDTGNEAVGEWLGEAVPIMSRMMLFQKLANNGAITGHTFGRILLPETGQAFPKVIVLDPGMVRPTWNPKNIDEVWRWALDFIAVDPDSAKPTQYRTVMEPNDRVNPTAWQITDKEGEPGTELVITEVTTWPHPFSPIVHCQNLPRANEFYGAADLEADLLDLQSSIDRVLSLGNKVVRNWSKPPTFARGLTAPQVAAFSANPDQINLLPGSPTEQDVFSLKSEADMPGLLDYKRDLVEHLREVAHLPEAASGKASGALSSLTLKLLFAPIVQMTEAKHNTYGQMITELVKRLLVVGKQVASYEAAPTPDLHWEGVVPSDEAAEIARDQTDLDIGFSKDTLITRRGGDPDTERAKREQDAVNIGSALIDNFNRGEELTTQ